MLPWECKGSAVSGELRGGNSRRTDPYFRLHLITISSNVLIAFQGMGAVNIIYRRKLKEGESDNCHGKAWRIRETDHEFVANQNLCGGVLG